MSWRREGVLWRRLWSRVRPPRIRRRARGCLRARQQAVTVKHPFIRLNVRVRSCRRSCGSSQYVGAALHLLQSCLIEQHGRAMRRLGRVTRPHQWMSLLRRMRRDMPADVLPSVRLSQARCRSKAHPTSLGTSSSQNCRATTPEGRGPSVARAWWKTSHGLAYGSNIVDASPIRVIDGGAGAGGRRRPSQPWMLQGS